MEDLTQEAAEDLGKLALNEDVGQESKLMEEAPSLEGILQRLSEMEV